MDAAEFPSLMDSFVMGNGVVGEAPAVVPSAPASGIVMGLSKVAYASSDRC